MICCYCLPLVGSVDPLRLCRRRGGRLLLGGHLAFGGGLRLLLPDVLSLPSPSRLGWACVAIATKALEHQGRAEGCAVHAYVTLWFPNKSFSLKVLFHNTKLMIDHTVVLCGDLFFRMLL